jgi:hypothetical protein
MVRLQWIAEAYGEDANLMFFGEIVAPIDEQEELVLIVHHGGVASGLDQFTERIASDCPNHW